MSDEQRASSSGNQGNQGNQETTTTTTTILSENERRQRLNRQRYRAMATDEDLARERDPRLRANWGLTPLERLRQRNRVETIRRDYATGKKRGRKKKRKERIEDVRQRRVTDFFNVETNERLPSLFSFNNTFEYMSEDEKFWLERYERQVGTGPLLTNSGRVSAQFRRWYLLESYVNHFDTDLEPPFEEDGSMSENFRRYNIEQIVREGTQHYYDTDYVVVWRPGRVGSVRGIGQRRPMPRLRVNGYQRIFTRNSRNELSTQWLRAPSNKNLEWIVTGDVLTGTPRLVNNENYTQQIQREIRDAMRTFRRIERPTNIEVDTTRIGLTELLHALNDNAPEGWWVNARIEGLLFVEERSTDSYGQFLRSILRGVHLILEFELRNFAEERRATENAEENNGNYFEYEFKPTLKGLFNAPNDGIDLLYSQRSYLSRYGVYDKGTHKTLNEDCLSHAMKMAKDEQFPDEPLLEAKHLVKYNALFQNKEGIYTEARDLGEIASKIGVNFQAAKWSHTKQKFQYARYPQFDNIKKKKNLKEEEKEEIYNRPLLKIANVGKHWFLNEPTVYAEYSVIHNLDWIIENYEEFKRKNPLTPWYATGTRNNNNVFNRISGNAPRMSSASLIKYLLDVEDEEGNKRYFQKIDMIERLTSIRARDEVTNNQQEPFPVEEMAALERNDEKFVDKEHKKNKEKGVFKSTAFSKVNPKRYIAQFGEDRYNSLPLNFYDDKGVLKGGGVVSSDCPAHVCNEYFIHNSKYNETKNLHLHRMMQPEPLIDDSMAVFEAKREECRKERYKVWKKELNIPNDDVSIIPEVVDIFNNALSKFSRENNYRNPFQGTHAITAVKINAGIMLDFLHDNEIKKQFIHFNRHTYKAKTWRAKPVEYKEVSHIPRIYVDTETITHDEYNTPLNHEAFLLVAIDESEPDNPQSFYLDTINNVDPSEKFYSWLNEKYPGMEVIVYGYNIKYDSCFLVQHPMFNGMSQLEKDNRIYEVRGTYLPFSTKDYPNKCTCNQTSIVVRDLLHFYGVKLSAAAEMCGLEDAKDTLPYRYYTMKRMYNYQRHEQIHGHKKLVSIKKLKQTFYRSVNYPQIPKEENDYANYEISIKTKLMKKYKLEDCKEFNENHWEYYNKKMDEYEEVETKNDYKNINEANRRYGRECRDEWRRFYQQIVKTNPGKTKKQLEKVGVDAFELCRYYCIKDVQITMQCAIFMRDNLKQHFNGIDLENYTTVSSMANDYCKKQGCFDDVYQLGGLRRFYMEQAIRGGRSATAGNKNYYIEGDPLNKTGNNLKPLDFNSLYPAALAFFQGFPKGKAKLLTPNELLNFKENWWDTDRYTQFIVQVYLKEDPVLKHDHPVLSFYNNETHKIDWINEWKGKYVWVDAYLLRDVIEWQPTDLEIIGGYYWDEGFNTKIRTVITHIYNQRVALKKDKNPLQSVYKLMMNSIYGKCLQKKSFVETKTFTADSEEASIYFAIHHKRFLRGYKFSNKIVLKFSKSGISDFGNVHLGVFVLNYSKRIMNRLLQLAQHNDIKVFYCDTDSVHVFSKDIPRLAELFKQTFQEEEEVLYKDLEDEYNLGCVSNDLKLPKGITWPQFDLLNEITPSKLEGEVTKAIFIGPKQYFERKHATLVGKESIPEVWSTVLHPTNCPCLNSKYNEQLSDIKNKGAGAKAIKHFCYKREMRFCDLFLKSGLLSREEEFQGFPIDLCADDTLVKFTNAHFSVKSETKFIRIFRASKKPLIVINEEYPYPGIDSKELPENYFYDDLQDDIEYSKQQAQAREDDRDSEACKKLGDYYDKYEKSYNQARVIVD
eukprot:Pgem_evm2s8004